MRQPLLSPQALGNDSQILAPMNDSAMKRIQIRPGKFVTVSASLVEKAERAFTSVAFTRDQVERITALEPRGTTIYLGRASPIHGVDRTAREAAAMRHGIKPPAHRRHSPHR